LLFFGNGGKIEENAWVTTGKYQAYLWHMDHREKQTAELHRHFKSVLSFVFRLLQLVCNYLYLTMLKLKLVSKLSGLSICIHTTHWSL